ncbi:MAG: hypothetical protein K6E93_05520 [Bacteroidales bacterium]|nr:hypothetical protein [Bacteroidales bacterium]
MKRRNKKLLYILFAVVLLIGIIVSNVVRSNSLVRGIKVVVDYNGNDTLVSANSIRILIAEQLPTLNSQKVKEVDCQAVAHTVMTNPYVEHCESSVSIGRDIIVKATQRTPIVRVFLNKVVNIPAQQNASDTQDSATQQKKGDTKTEAHECYFDKEGRYVPLSQEGSCNVIIANGHIKEQLSANCASFDAKKMSEDSKLQEMDIIQLWILAEFLYSHEEYGPLFDQIYVNENRDLCLVPKVGNHIVILGHADNLDKKFHDLLVFYRKAMNQVGWNTYKQINLKYKDQLICTERKDNK